MRVVYLPPEQAHAPPAPFRTGLAGMLVVDLDGELETRVDVRLSANSTHALLGHGVVDALNALPLEGQVGSRLQALIPPSSLDAALRIFYEADRKTYGDRYEFVVDRSDAPEPTEYRIRIDNREYQVSLNRLQFLSTQASRTGKAVWIQI